MDQITINDPESRSEDLVAENVKSLKLIFPEAFAEGKIDFEVLRQLLGDNVEEKEERYGLNWFGKRQARKLALTPSTGTLRPCLEDSVEWESTKNLMIEGNNLEVLKLLQKSYAGRVKMIYIDPPYNTGKDFVYPDDFQDSIKNYLEITGQIEGGRVKSTNNESSGRFHTDWLNMMYPRLKLARNLLSSDGVIITSIDDNEVMNLKAVLDEVFYPENFIAILPTIMNLKGNNDQFAFAGTHEYTIIYALSKERCVVNEWPLDVEELDDWEEDEIGPYKKGASLKATGGNAPRERRPNLFFPLYISRESLYVSVSRNSSNDIELFPRTDGKDMSWRWSKDKFSSQPNDVIINFNSPDDVILYKKQRPALGETPSKKPKSIFYKPEYSSGNGTAEIKALLGSKALTSPPKPLRLMRDLIILFTDSESIVMDFFAGSGTTGQATMSENLIDQGNRRFILVQLPESLDINDKDQMVGAQLCEELGKPHTISEITKERLRRAGKKIKAENPLFSGDLGFRVFKLDTTNIQEWEADGEDLPKTLEDSIEHLKLDRTEMDILYEILLKLGLDLCVPVEKKQVDDKTIYSVGGGVLMACLAEKLTRSDVEPVANAIITWHKELQPVGETTCVFRDSAFEDDVAKTNLAAILEQNDLTNVRSL